LIKAGAFDQLGHTRRSLFDIHESVVESALRDKKAEEHGDVGFDFDALFEAGEQAPPPRVPDLPEWSKRELLALERDMLGLYVSDHPLSGMERGLRQEADVSVGALLDASPEDGSVVTVAGLITSVAHRVARNSGNPYAQATLEDFTGEVSLLFLGKSYTENQNLLQPDSIVAVRGRVQERDDSVIIQGQQVRALHLTSSTDRFDGPLTLNVPEFHATADVLRALDEALGRHEGESEVRLRLTNGSVARVFALPRRVSVSTELIGEVKSVLGPNCLAS